MSADKEKIIIKKFASALEFTQWATTAPSPWKGKLASRRVWHELDAREIKWSGTKNYDEAYKLAVFGWPEGLSLLSTEIECADRFITQQVASSGSSPDAVDMPYKGWGYDVAGYRPHPGRAAAGELFSMMVPKRAKLLPLPVAHFSYNFGVACNIPSHNIMTFGGAFCSYVKLLESMGVKTYISGVCASSHDDRLVLASFPLKKIAQPVSAASLVFWLAHPAATRRIFLSAIERVDVEKWFRIGYGIPFALSDKMVEKEIVNINLNKDLPYETMEHKEKKFIDLDIPMAVRLISRKYRDTLDQSPRAISLKRSIERLNFG